MPIGSNTSAHIFDTTFTTNGIIYSAASGVMTSTASGTAGQVLTSNGSGAAPTFQSAPTMTDTTATTLSSNVGYFATAAGTYTLPASPAQGDTVIVACDTTGAVAVTGNTGQLIRLSSAVTAAAGALTSTARGDSLTLRYRTSGTTWIATSSIGNWTT